MIWDPRWALNARYGGAQAARKAHFMAELTKLQSQLSGLHAERVRLTQLLATQEHLYVAKQLQREAETVRERVRREATQVAEQCTEMLQGGGRGSRCEPDALELKSFSACYSACYGMFMKAYLD